MPTSPEAEISVESSRSPDDAAVAAGVGAIAAKLAEKVDGRAVAAGGKPMLNSQASTGPIKNEDLGLPVSRSMLDRLQAKKNEELIGRHRAEYGESSIWLWRRTVGAAFAFIVVTVTWYLLKLPSGLISDQALPSQTQVSTAFTELRVDGFAGSSLGRHVGSSLFRLTLGLGIGSMFGVGFGLMVGTAPMLRTIVDPVISFLRMMPGLVLGPLVLVWFGAGERAAISAVALSVMWVTLNSAADARARALRGAAIDLPLEVIAGTREALLLGWAKVLALEAIAMPSGLGAMIWFAQGRSDVILAGLIIAGIIGFVLDTLLRATEYCLANG